MWDLGRVREYARSNHGVVDRATVLELGATDDIIQRQVNGGRWEELHPGVYYLNVTPITWHTRVRAAVLAAGVEALASHRTAGLLWNLDGVRGRIVEVTVPYSDKPIPRGVVLHRTRRPLPSDVAEGIPTTSVERTLLDLARYLPDLFLEKALMSALRQQLTTVDSVGRLLVEHGGSGVRGTKKLRRVLALADDGITGSPAEVEAAQLIRSAPVSAPVAQMAIHLPDGSNAYPDFCWPGRMKIVEIDGLDAHSSSDLLHNDLLRQNMLMELGWQMRRFSARQVRRNPRSVREEIVRFING